MISFNGQNIVNNGIILQNNEENIFDSYNLSYDTYNQNFNKLQKCIRRIVINKNIYATGFLMELKKEKTPFYCLITNEFIISEDLIESNT